MGTQKLYRNGNSLVITIPKQFLDKLKLKEGGKIELEYYPHSKMMSITPVGKKTKDSSISPGFLKAYEDIFKRYGSVFKELADK